jgi:uncharacterized protein (DUF2267 family)
LHLFSLAIVHPFVIKIPSMTKKDLIEKVRDISRFQKKEAEEIVESVLDIMNTRKNLDKPENRRIF